MPIIRVGPGVFLEENSNSNSSNSSSNSNSSFNLSNSDSNVSNWNEPIHQQKNNPHRKIRFHTHRRVRQIPALGESLPVRRHSTTRKRLTIIPNKSEESKIKFAAARLIAAAHAKKHTYNEMVEFIKRARGPANVKAAALKRFVSRYHNFNLNSNLPAGPIATMAAKRHYPVRPATAAAARSVTPARYPARSVTPSRKNALVRSPSP